MSVSDGTTRKLKAACFDLDGTLVDTGPPHLEAERLALAALGIPELAPDHPVTFGAGVLPGMQMLADHYGLPSAEHVLEAYLPAWETTSATGIVPMPGAQDALETLQRLGVPTALVTSGEDEYVDMVLARFNWAEFFTHRVTLESVNNLKPHPEPYLTAAKLLELPPEQCAGIEDSASGLRSLRAAGFCSVVVQADAALRKSQPDADIALRSLTELDEKFASRLFAL